MPTFFDSTADAAEASEALRGLVHASRMFDQPAQMYTPPHRTGRKCPSA